MKKRILSLLSAAVLSISLLAGCAQEADEKAADAESTPSEETEPKELVEVTLNEVAHSIFYAPMYAAIEEGYFEEEGIDLTLVCGFGADKTMTAVISGEADIGFMGSEASIYTYAEGATDHVVNFAQLTQRAGNFLVAREEMPDFTWEDIKGHLVLGGRKGGMPEMVFEYILKQNGIDPGTDLEINQNIDFGSTAAAFSEGQGDFTVEKDITLHPFSPLNQFSPCHIIRKVRYSTLNSFPSSSGPNTSGATARQYDIIAWNKITPVLHPYISASFCIFSSRTLSR